jgi:hypothetical protein
VRELPKKGQQTKLIHKKKQTRYIKLLNEQLLVTTASINHSEGCRHVDFSVIVFHIIKRNIVFVAIKARDKICTMPGTEATLVRNIKIRRGLACTLILKYMKGLGMW